MAAGAAGAQTLCVCARVCVLVRPQDSSSLPANTVK